MKLRGLVSIPGKVFINQRKLGLSAGEIVFICNILAAEGSVSVKEMSDQMGISQRHVHNLKNRLISKGYLCIAGKNQNMENIYSLSGLFAALEGMKSSSGEGRTAT